MSRFDSVRYDCHTETLDVGAGCLWDQVYIVANNLCRNVVGGSAHQGVGVAGYILGGGYSRVTNQFGLAIDNVVAFQVVLPNGDIVNASEDDTDFQDLFWALKVCRNKPKISGL